MTESVRTVVFVGLAALLAGAAALTTPVPPRVALLSEVGEPLTPALTDPTAVGTLRVTGYDEAAARFNAFDVTFDGTRWVIPSQFRYPADAEQKMAKAAAAFVGLRKEGVATDSREDHGALGVVQPDDESAGTSGRGTRVTMLDRTGQTLVDLVLGRTAPGENPGSAEDTSRRYVREVGKNRVYITTLEGGFSTRFTDWVETDLLKLETYEVDRIAVDRYSVDESTGMVSDAETVTLRRASPSAPWELDARPGGPPGEQEQVASARVEELLGALDRLTIAGVRPKPESLANMLAAPGSELTLDVRDQLSLQMAGFYLSPDGRLVANEGQATVSTTDGVVYSLWFGEVIADAGEAAAGGAVSGATEGAPSGAAPGNDLRSMMITVAFDPALVPEPAKPGELEAADRAKAAREQAGDGTPEAEQAGPEESPELASARSAYNAALESWKQRAERGRTKAADLSRRFAGWYYLIDAQSFDRLRPRRSELVEPRTPEAPAQDAPAGTTP